MAFYARSNTDLACHAIIQESPWGFYIFVFETEDSEDPEKDYLQNTLEIAKLCCLDDYGITEEEWKDIPDNQECLDLPPPLPWE